MKILWFSPSSGLSIITKNVLKTNTQPFLSQALEIPNILGDGTISGSCNGIICLALPRLAALYNPITREHCILPPGLLGSYDFHKTYGNEILSFGFDQSTDDYKVVRICFDGLNTKRYVEIYRQRMKCWRKVEFRNLPLLDHITFHQESSIGVFMNGIVHWVVSPSLKIFTFDFEAEEFGEMESGYHETDVARTCVALVDDSLAVVCRKREFNSVDVWVMEEYGNKESWTGKFSVRLPFCELYGVATCWVNDTNQLVVLMSNGNLILFPGNDEPARILAHREYCDVNGVVFQLSLIALPSII